MTKILIIDDEAPIRDVMAASLRDEGYEVQVAQDGESGLKETRQFQPDIAFLDIWMPGKMDGLEVLNRARQEFPNIEFVMISGHGTIETAVKATKLGAYDFIEKPLSMDKINIIIHNILNYLQEKNEKIALLTKLRKNIAMIGDTAGVVEVKQFISKMAPTQFPILLLGEHGSGKELVAQNIHYMSSRASYNFVDLNCSSIAEDLLDSEIFGLEKGALPGVERTRKGKIELADRGTLYIEEISDMNLGVQEKILKYLKEKKIYRVGSQESVPVNTRLILSSTKNIEKQVEQGLFLKELFDMMKSSFCRMPNLRDRVADIQTLISFFGDTFARETGEPKKGFSEKALEILKQHNWPGNVRELKNFVERVYILTPGEYVDVHDVKFAGLEAQESSGDFGSISSFRDARSKFEKEYLIQKIQENDGNISKTAEMIGLERSYLHRKIKAYGIATKEL